MTKVKAVRNRVHAEPIKGLYLKRKFEAKILDDNAEWIINHVSSWGDCDKIGYEALPVIDALADARKALKRAHEYSLTDRDIVLVNREIYRQYKRLLKEY